VASWPVWSARPAHSFFTVSGNAQPNLSLRGAKRRSNLLPDEPRYARQAGDCFVAARLAMTGLFRRCTLLLLPLLRRARGSTAGHAGYGVTLLRPALLLRCRMGEPCLKSKSPSSTPAASSPMTRCARWSPPCRSRCRGFRSGLGHRCRTRVRADRRQAGCRHVVAEHTGQHRPRRRAGHHDLTPDGLPVGKSFAGTDKHFGHSWTVTASHELLEMLADPTSTCRCSCIRQPRQQAVRV